MPRKKKKVESVTEETKERAVTRWYFNPKSPLSHQEWQIKKDKKWETDEDKEFPQMTDRNLMKKWMFTVFEEKDATKKSISVIARYFGAQMRDVKTKKSRINTEYRKLRNVKVDILPPLDDWTPYEQSRIDAANKKQDIGDIFDSLPDSLREHAEKLLKG